MEQHLPILQVLVPLLAAPICVAVRHRRLTFAVAFAASWGSLLVAGLNLAHVLRDGPISYSLGGFVAPFGIEYRIDTLSGFVAVLVSAIGALTMTYSPASIASEIPARKHYLFHTMMLLCLAGLLGITVTGDLFNLFVFLEISALSSYALIALGRNRRALTASFQYLVMGTIGATFILIGIGLMYMMTGTLNMADMAARIGPVESTRTVLVGFAFLSVGICLKMALFPLHSWLPNAYAYAPSVVTAFLAATATKVAVYILVRFVYTVYGVDFAFGMLPLNEVLMPLALAGIFVTSTVAIFQTNVKRMLAYSSVAQIGYMVLGVSFGTADGLTAGLVHLFNHALIKGGLFLAMGCIVLRIGSDHVDDFRGLGRQMPWTMFAWVLGGLNLIGVPLTAGFVSKWYLIRAALVNEDLWPVAALILVSSLLALVYVWRVVEVAYFRDPPAERGAVEAPPAGMALVTWIAIGATLYFGVFTTFNLGIARRAAEALLGVAP